MTVTAEPFVHRALLYDSIDELVAAVAPLLAGALERGDAVFAATKRANARALRGELGDHGRRLMLHDTDEWQPRPYDRLQAFRRLAGELPEGRVLHALGEPIWHGSEAAVRQWARHESLLNLALAGAPMQLTCLYDSAALPDRILEYALHTHPEHLDGGPPAPSPAFVPPERFTAGLPPSPPPRTPELPPEGPELRGALGRRALEAGLPAGRVEELVLAASEVATNAAMHGRPPVRAHIWTRNGDVVCQIADAGPGIADPLAGWIRPTHPAGGGWGLPLAHELCDAVEITPASGGGTTVTLHLALPAGARGG